MGNFIIILYNRAAEQEASSQFKKGLKVAYKLKKRQPISDLTCDFAMAAKFQRLNDTGSKIAFDVSTKSWLLSIGTWFHKHNYGSGDEYRLLSRYLQIGSELLANELEGFFTIVIGDASSKETVVITDLVGSSHCFQRSWKYGVALSSSSLILAGIEKISLDHIGCQEFTCTGAVYEDRTIFNQIKKMEPATIYKFENGSIKSKKRYWNVIDIEPESLGGTLAVKTIWNKLTHSAERVGRMFKKPVCDLTGGYDSRALVAAFIGAGVPFSTTVSGPVDSKDVIISKKLSNLLKIDHKYILTKNPKTLSEFVDTLQFTDGEINFLNYERILQIHRNLSRQYNISINGSYGGLARGWRWELLFPNIGERKKLDSFKLAKMRYAPANCDRSIFPRDIRLDFVSHFTDIIERTNSSLTNLPNTLQMDYVNLSMRIQRWQGRIASSTNQIWPCLSLFGLRSVLEAVLQTKVNLRIRSLLIRQMLFKYQPEIAQFPLDRGYPASPVTLKNLLCFIPAISYFGKRILAKINSFVYKNLSSKDSYNTWVNVKKMLWETKELQQALQPSCFKISSIMDKTALANFIELSQRSDFKFEEQLLNMLTLEFTLRYLEEVYGTPN